MRLCVCVHVRQACLCVLSCVYMLMRGRGTKREKERRVYIASVYLGLYIFFFKRCQVGPYRVLQFDPIGEYNPLCRVFNITPCEGFYLEPSINGSTSPISL